MQMHARLVVTCSLFPDDPYRPVSDDAVGVLQAMPDACPGDHALGVEVWHHGEWQLAEVGR